MSKWFRCPGCGQHLQDLAAAGRHAKLSMFCTSEMRFWGRVKKTDSCWLWQGAVNTTGYGMTAWYGKKNVVAHRKAWELLKGPIPDGLLVLHTCDTPRCVNTSHLFLGTDADNHKDKSLKGRAHNALLTHDQVREIRKLFGTMFQKDIAERFGVKPGVISAIKHGGAYRHIK